MTRRTSAGLGGALALAVLGVVIALGAGPASAGPGTLGPASSYGVGAAPSGVAIADLNGDHRPDLVVAASSANIVSVLIGHGDGTFGPRRDFATLYNPVAVRVADVTADGRPDVLVLDKETNATTGAVSVFPGTGTAAVLGPRTDYQVGADPQNFALGDVNGDGRPDIVTANEGDDTVSVLHGKPAGFATQVKHAGGSGPFAVALADLDGDGRTDIAVSDTNGNTVSVLTHTVLGLAVTATPAVGTRPTGIAAVDLNGDGRPDLVVGSFTARTVTVLRNTAGTAFARSDHPAGTDVRALAVGDVTGDGRVDVVAAGQGPDVVSVLAGRAGGALGAPATTPTGGTPLGLAVGDVNGDGRSDVMTTSYNNSTVDVLANTGPGTRPVAPPPSAQPSVTTSATPPPSTATPPRPSNEPVAITTRAAGLVADHRSPSSRPTVRPAVPSAAQSGVARTAGTRPAAGSGGHPSVIPTGRSRPHAAAQFSAGLPSPTALTLTQVLHVSLLALLALALLSLPIVLVNKTAVANAEELARFGGWIRRRLRLDDVARHASGLSPATSVGLTALVGGLLYAFLVPSFGWNESSLALVLGLMLGLLVLTALGKLTQRHLLVRAGAGAGLRLYPGFALIALACVVVSRVGHLHPGLLLGTLLSVGYLRELSPAIEGRAAAGALAVLGTGGALAWIGRSDLVSVAAHLGGFAAQAAGVLASSVAIGAAQAMAFESLPLAYLDGLAVYRWSRPAWAVLAGLGAFGFVLVLLRPTGSTASLLSRTGHLLVLLGVYLVCAGAFWAWFRYRPARHRAAEPPRRPQPVPR